MQHSATNYEMIVGATRSNKMLVHFHNPLIDAARSGSDEEVEHYLAQSKRHGLAKDMHGRSALMYAAIAGRDDWMALLLPHSYPLDQDCNGQSALILSAMHGHHACVQRLLPHSDPLVMDKSGYSALMCAAVNGQEAALVHKYRNRSLCCASDAAMFIETLSFVE